jgi:hypothetical protein
VPPSNLSLLGIVRHNGHAGLLRQSIDGATGSCPSQATR